jgi:hypothetical protein
MKLILIGFLVSLSGCAMGGISPTSSDPRAADFRERYLPPAVGPDGYYRGSAADLAIRAAEARNPALKKQVEKAQISETVQVFIFQNAQ